LSTTILQQAGSILLEVEKRNVKHFEVETPYLAAVVKGTQFRVSVNAAGTSVDVLRGQVEVADFKSGQIAQLLPGQMATAFAQGKAGLTLSGSGTFNPIEQGKPRAPSIQRIMVPKTGLPAPRHATNGQQIRSLAALSSTAGGPKPGPAVSQSAPAHNALRISSSLGEVRLNFHQVTHGLARGMAPNSHAGRTSATRDTVWSSRNTKASTIAVGNSGQGNSADGGNASAMTTSIASGTAAATSAATAAATVVSNNAGDSNGTGNGNSSNNGNGRGNNGNGNGNGGANGNGNNGNNGHGHAYGRGH
jgi:hypothetical protein